MICFVDTSAFIAAALRRDAHHAAAAEAWTTLQQKGAQLVTTDWVFGETVTFLRRRAGYDIARDAGEAIRSSAVVDVRHPNPEAIERAWDLFLGFPYADLSLVDCVSFVVMRQLKIRRAFSYDQHFAEAGFELLQ